MCTIRIDRTFDKDAGDGHFHYVIFVDEVMDATRTARADWLEERHLRRMNKKERLEVEEMAAHNRAEACRCALTQRPREELERVLQQGPSDEELVKFKLDAAKWAEIARGVLG